jgi:putative salt-induced outer membrane protein YdiY
MEIAMVDGKDIGSAVAALGGPKLALVLAMVTGCLLPVPSVGAQSNEQEGGQEQPVDEEQKKIPWKLSIDFSLNSTTGNTEEQTLRFGLTAGYETPKTRLAIDSSYYFKATSGITTDNKFTLGGRHDWLLPESRWFWFVAGRLDYDQFESWEERVNAQAGPGYHIIQRDDFEMEMTWDLYAGIGARKEFGSLNDQTKLEGALGTVYTLQITERQSLQVDVVFFPVLDDWSDYRLRSTGNWRYVLDQDYHLALVIGYLLEYQSIADPGKLNEDFRIWIGIQYSF